jgi:hypothetical protein
LTEAPKAPKASRVGSWYRARQKKQKEQDEQERRSGPSRLKIVTLLITTITMAVAFSVLPLLPQPLPILLAFLVGFMTYKKPIAGMPLGTAIIGLGLIFHLADLNFISMLGATNVREAFIFVIMGVFIALPIAFHRYKDALAIDFGIIAVMLLFFEPVYFLAIPLILTSAVYFKKSVGLTATYYILISAPLQIIQYFQHISTIARSDWWIAPGASPPLFVSLDIVFKKLTPSMSQFRLFDSSQVVYTIKNQVFSTTVPVGRSIKDALSQYLDSVPGIFLFIAIVVGVSLALILLMRTFVSESSSSNKLYPIIIATISAALFFVLLISLQSALAFTTDVNAITIMLGTMSTLLLTLPTAFIDFTPKKKSTFQEIPEKAREILSKLQVFEDDLNYAKENTPVTVSSTEGKMLVVKDSVKDILSKAEMQYYEASEVERKLEELEKYGKDIDDLECELNTILKEFQILVTSQFSSWIGKIKDTGLTVNFTVNSDFQPVMTIRDRVDVIKQTIDGAKALAVDVAHVAEPIYSIITQLYDPSLPQKSRAVEFTMQKIAEKQAPWIALEALYSSLNNWRRQYGAEILATMQYLQKSLAPIANFTGQSEVLPHIFKDNLPKILDYAKKAETLKFGTDGQVKTDQLKIVDVIALKDEIQFFLDISKEVLSSLYSGIISDEEEIERLLPTKDYLWQKNTTLRDYLKKANDTLANPSSYKINEVIQSLPSYLSCVDDAVQTLAFYRDQKEFLLNYPTAEAAIEEQLKSKRTVSAKDLSFQPNFAAEYLRLYHSSRFSEFSYNYETQTLARIS